MNDFLSLLSGQKENFDGIAAGDNFTDKQFFTDKPLIKGAFDLKKRRFA